MKTNNSTNHSFFITALAMTAVLALASCSSKDGGSPTSAAPQGPVSNGTSSAGGGGNGLDNKTLELYAIHIDTLPEYKRYIEPVIRKIGRGRGDVITSYMDWTVHKKPWYLIPRALADLPQDQVGTAFPTEQLALHSDNWVYLAKAAYQKMNQKERASLLMHEIVMGARLLMKKTPKEQCEKLSGSQVAACSDPEMMKLAEAQDIREGDRGTMDQHDHDAVRAMTIFLMDHTQDLTATAVTAMRRQLGFIFPWDTAVSDLTLADVTLALKRTQISGTQYVPNAGFKKFAQAVNLSCRLAASSYSDDDLNITLKVAKSEPYPTYQIGQVPSDWYPVQMEPDSWANPNEYYAVFGQPANIYAMSDSMEARGALDPANPKRVIDIVTLHPVIGDQSFAREAAEHPDRVSLSEIEILMTRDERPEILQLATHSLAVMIKGHPDLEHLTPDDWEFERTHKGDFQCSPVPSGH